MACLQINQEYLLAVSSRIGFNFDVALSNLQYPKTFHGKTDSPPLETTDPVRYEFPRSSEDYKLDPRDGEDLKKAQGSCDLTPNIRSSGFY